jgi:hypothetical protein
MGQNGATGNRYAYIDMVGDDTYADYGLRIIRNNTGANTNSEISHRGTGSLVLSTSDAGSDIVLTPADKIGLGTTTPDSRVQISGGGLCVGSDTNCNTDNNTEGIVYSSSINMTVYDVAEDYPTKDETLGPGEMVALDPNNEIFVRRADGSTGEILLGVISTQPAVHLGGFNGTQFQGERQVAVGLSGRVPVRVTAEGGEIAVGDPLTSSSIPGVAKKAAAATRVIGYALESYRSGGVGSIQFFINPGWYDPGVLVDSGGYVAQANQDGSTTKIASPTIEAEEGWFDKLTIAVEAIFKKIIADTAEIVSAFVKDLTVDQLTVTDKTSGQAVVPAGKSELRVMNELITSTSKVFVTFRDSYAPATNYWVADVAAGESFAVTLDQPVSADSRLDYWIVN